MNFKKSRVEKAYKYLVVFLIPIICMVVHMAMKDCYPFGNNTILIGDANCQYYAFFMELADKIKNGKSIFFSWNGGMGYDFYSNFFYYLASPFNIIAMLFGRSHMELGMIVSMLVQVGSCGVTMLYYFAHTKRNKMHHGKLNDAVCILFSLAYAMCDYIVAYQYNMIWLISFVLLPLVMLGIEKLVEDNDVRLYFVTLFLVLVTNFYFAWFICIFAVIWFADQKKSGIKVFFKKFTRFALSSIVSAMCAAVVLIPCYLAVLKREDKWVSVNDYGIGTFANIGNFFQSFFWGHDIDTLGSGLFADNNYCGLFTILLCLVFVFNKKISAGYKLKRIIEIIILAVCMNWIGASYVLHGFTIPHMFSNRFAFMLIVLFIVTAFEALTSYEEIRLRYISIIALVCVLGITLVFVMNNEVQNILCYMVTILLIVYFILLLIFSRKQSIKRISVIMNVVIIGFIELISNFYFVNGESYDISMDRISATDEWAGVYEQIETNNMERKTSWIDSINNMVYSDTNLFASSINSDLLWLFDSVGLAYQNNGGSYVYRGTTPATALMFNVRNVLTNSIACYGGYQEVASYHYYNKLVGTRGKYGIYETDYIAGIGYLVPDDITHWNTSSKNPFTVQNDFINRISGISDVFTKVSIDELDDFTVMNQFCKLFTDSAHMYMKIKGNSDNVYMYQNLGLDESKKSAIAYGFEVPYDMHLYVYIQDARQTQSLVYIDGKALLGENYYPAPTEMIDLGNLSKGQTVLISVYNNSKILDYGTTVIDFYEYHDDRMQACMKSLDNKSLTVDKVKDTYIKGEIYAEESGVLFTSIPYYRGFKAYVDGKETDIIRLGNNALCGLELTAGEHIIEFKYLPYGFLFGAVISAVGVLIVVTYIIIKVKRTKGYEGKK
ncbi:MAG: YfhO family protein [Coprococcus sp.]|nr:YfhO family protein [Coprococcus sp.]